MDVPDYRARTADTAPSQPVAPRRSTRGWYLLILLITIGTVSGVLFLQSAIQPPANFPVGSTVEITSGTGVKVAAAQLESASIVKSKWVLYAVIWWYHDPTALKASTYRFTEPQDVFLVANTLMNGDFASNLIRFTHTEGERARAIAENATAVLTDFDAALFIQLAEPHEGKLFPETYLIPPNFTAEALVATMLAAYETNVEPLRKAIASSTFTETEVVILASIIEREANTPESMKMVSGILQNRLRIGMALQTDASIEYVLDKPLQELTPGDLKSDSRYNTYAHNELPPTPIGNPGLDSITAVLEPTPSKYLFYITDNDGVFHFAETFDEHRINVARYLR